MFFPQENPTCNETIVCQQTEEQLSTNPDVYEMRPPEAKRAKLLTSSCRISPVLHESVTEEPLGPGHGEVVCELTSVQHPSCSGQAKVGGGGIEGIASLQSPREIQESPPSSMATMKAIDHGGNAPGVNRHEEDAEEDRNEEIEECFKPVCGESPMPCQIDGLRRKGEGLIFSSDEENNLINTQINRQIERVEKFLKQID